MLCVACGVLVALGCGKKPTEPLQLDAEAGFPHAVGNWWIYDVYDSVRSTSDTVTVTIVDTTRLENGALATVWLYEYPDRVDTQYVTVSGDTVNMYSDRQRSTNFRSARYVLPLEVGNGWRGLLISDSTIVRDKDSVCVTAGCLPGGFRIESNWGGFNVYGHRTDWLVPGIGVVSIHLQWICTVCMGPFPGINEYWDLLSYDVQR